MNNNFRGGFLSFLVFSTCLSAQVAPTIRQNNFELGVFGGTSFALDKVRFMGGANIAYAATRYFLPYAEFSYFPKIDRSIPPTGDEGFEQRYATKILDYHVGSHIRIPIQESPIVPYFVVAAGGITTDDTQAYIYQNGTLLPGLTRELRGGSAFAINGGVGVRWYTSEKWGFRLEYKTYKAVSGDMKDPFYRLTAGLFYQFH